MTEPGGWLRLDPRMLAVAPAQELAKFFPLLIVAVIAGGSRGQPWWVFGVLAVAASTGVLRWLTTRYRVSAERVEVHSGLVFRQHRSVPRDRVRTVDVTANPLHRAFGLAVLRVGTGRQDHSLQQELALNAITAAEAERLRAALLDRSNAIIEPSAAVSAVATASTADTAAELSRLSWSWLRFAPLTPFGVIAVGALLGGGWQLLNEAGVDPDELSVVSNTADWLTGSPLWLVIGAPLLALLAVGGLGSLVLYVEAWWHYRLTRHADGTLRVSRGLLTKRSVSLEERRLRGVEVEEPLLLRAGRGARCDAVATGSGGTGRASLLPPAPRAEAHRVAAAVLRCAEPPTLARLRLHPVAALRRRLIRTLIPAAVVIVGLTIADGWLPSWPWQLALVVLLPASLLLGVDRYRNLGHANTTRHLVARQGSLVRQTVALAHQGIIGWRVRQSIFQRRAGLATVTATTAAGTGAYEVLDVELAAGLRLADAATPGLLTTFLAEHSRAIHS